MESEYTIAHDAARELDQILNVGATLFLQSIRTPGAPPLRAALGFSLEPLQSGHVVCLADVSDVTESAARYVDFPVQVDRRVVAAMKTLFLYSFQETEAVSSESSEATNQARDNLDNIPHVTRAMLRRLHPTVLVLAWVCTPQHDIYVTCRRHQVREAYFTSDEQGDYHQRLHCVMKELVLLDLLLSICPKIKSLWEYRRWLCFNMCSYGFLSDKPTESSQASLSISRFEVQDDELFFVTAQDHPMNYNAWQYRRQRLRLVHESASMVPTRRNRAYTAIQRDSEHVIEFLRSHNGDASATSYLLFLLRELDALEKKDDRPFFAKSLVKDPQQVSDTPHESSHYCQMNRSKEEVSEKREDEVCPLSSPASALWRSLMALTQAEIRQHSEKGHECIWHLRLGLVQWALTRPPQSRPLSLWSTKDELEWTTAYVELCEADSADVLLAPISTLPQAWTESFGSSPWTSYNAARYGYQLSRILLHTPSYDVL